MFVTVLLPGESIGRLCEATHADCLVTPVADDVGLMTAILTGATDAIVLDPLLVRGDLLPRIGQAVEVAHAAVILYFPLTPEAVYAAGAALRSIHADVVVREHEDRLRLEVALAAAPSVSVTSRVATAIEPRLRELPGRLRLSVTTMFADPQAFPTADALALASAMSRRSLDRWLLRAGIASSRILVAGARISYGSRYLLDRRIPLSRAASLLGYSCTKPLDRQCRALFGLSARSVRSTLSLDDCVSLAAQRLVTHCASRSR